MAKFDAAERGRKAEELFTEEYNCAQSVFCAYAEECGLELGTAAKIASTFGGGMGRMREVCGAVTGALMVMGLLRGYDDPKEQDSKAALYEQVQEFGRRFREANGSIICRELLAAAEADASAGGAPEARTAAYYHARPCARLVRSGAELLAQMLNEE